MEFAARQAQIGGEEVRKKLIARMSSLLRELAKSDNSTLARLPRIS